MHHPVAHLAHPPETRFPFRSRRRSVHTQMYFHIHQRETYTLGQHSQHTPGDNQRRRTLHHRPACVWSRTRSRDELLVEWRRPAFYNRETLSCGESLLATYEFTRWLVRGRCGCIAESNRASGDSTENIDPFISIKVFTQWIIHGDEVNWLQLKICNNYLFSTNAFVEFSHRLLSDVSVGGD